ncbi:hypothetical protein [Microcoleus vaginatus]|uniref:hypothetical protein n=1 Tax=Microcoleus vaginatus TaxID=119532 RepID=UPI0013052ABD
MQPCYEGAIVAHLLGRSNICDRYERMTQRLSEKKPHDSYFLSVKSASALDDL